MNKKQIELLRKAYKKESNSKIRERILMIEGVMNGETIREIGERFHCTHPVILYWKKRYVIEGIGGLKTRLRSGKPKLISRRKEEKLIKVISEDNPANNPWTTKKVCELIKKETGIKYSQRHVQRLLHKWKFSLLVPRPTFWQKASGEEIKNFWKKNPEIEERLS